MTNKNQNIIKTSTSRFGHKFSIEYQAGVSPNTSASYAKLFRDGVLIGILRVSSCCNEKWDTLHLIADGEVSIISPGVFGCEERVLTESDREFASEAEDYVIGILQKDLLKILQKQEHSSEPIPVLPGERASRIVRALIESGVEPNWTIFKNCEHLTRMIECEIESAIQDTMVNVGNIVETTLRDVYPSEIQRIKIAINKWVSRSTQD